MKKHFLFVRRYVIFGTVLFIVSSCSPSGTAYQSPANDEQLFTLENRLTATQSPEVRAELFFLWGQELAAKAQSGNADPGLSAPSEAVPLDFLALAIGAFERVVDLNIVLVPESRINLELLYRQKQAQDQQKQDQQKQDQQKQSDQKQDEQENGEANKDQKADPQGTDSKGSSGTQDQPNGTPDRAKDMSSLAREKAPENRAEEALEAEAKRRAQLQQVQQQQQQASGGITPVEKDW